MESHYEINVSVNGRHVFATAPRSFTNLSAEGLKNVLDVAEQLRAAFPGAGIAVTRYDCGGSFIMRETQRASDIMLERESEEVSV